MAPLRLSSALLLLAALPISAQQLNTFSNGEVADANMINENFRYVLDNAGGGCSATQQDNSVLIECADGTSGVLPGYGSLVIVPSGTVTAPSITEVSVGEIYIVDANDAVLATLYNVNSPSVEYMGWTSWQDIEDAGVRGSLLLTLRNEGGKVVAVLDQYRGTFYYASEDCSGQPLTEPGDTYSLLYSADDTSYYVVIDNWTDGFLAKSKKVLVQDVEASSDEACAQTEQVLRVRVPTPFQFPPEILNAAYPIRLQQF